MGSLDIIRLPTSGSEESIAGLRVEELPGQRQGAQAWFNHLVEFLESIGFEFCKENACLGRKADQVFVLFHADYILHYGQEEAVQNFIGQLRGKFEISVSQMKSPGDEFQF